MQTNEGSGFSQAPAVQTKQPTDWLSIGQLVLGGLSLILSLLGAGLLGIFGLSMVFGELGQSIETTSIFGITWVGLFLAALAVPSIVFSLRQLLRNRGMEGGDRKPANNLRTATIVLILWPLLILIGMLIARETSLSWLVLPPLQLLIIAIPTWWLIELIRYKLPAASRQREWGLVNFSIFVTTPVLMLVEIVAFVILLAIFALWVTSRPDLMAELERAMGQILIAPSDPQVLLDIFTPYLSNPWVIAGTIGAAAVLVPMIEELLKPLGVLLLAGRNPTQADGFVAGALCGAAFGLVESLLYLTNPAGEGWVELAVGRTGTVLLHTATTALVGWALARAWQGRGGLRLLGTYLLAVALHGLWNGLAILTGFGAILRESPDRSPTLSSLAFASPIGIVLLGVALFGVLLWGNRRLRQQAALANAAEYAEPRPIDQL